jgi:transcription elongation factor GreA
MADSDFVNIGTRVTAREVGTEHEHTFVFLGPWDADSDQNILNYKAPLALAFMGKKVGETVTFGEDEDLRQWEVLSIEPAIT